jgi:hypothetical protein
MDNRSPRPAAPSLAALLGGIMKDAKDLGHVPGVPQVADAQLG